MEPKRNKNGNGGIGNALRGCLRKAGAAAARCARKAGAAVARCARKAYLYVLSLPAPVRLAGITAVGFLLIAAILLPAAIPDHPEAFIFAYGEVDSDLAHRAPTEAPAATPAPTGSLPQSVSDPGDPEPGTEADPGEDPEDDPVPDPASVEFRTVRDGDRDDIVLVIQQRLMELGYMDSDEPTRYFGSLTKHAMKTFQRHNGLGDDGVCGEETYALLMSDEAKRYVMQLGDEGDDVEGVQQLSLIHI